MIQDHLQLGSTHSETGLSIVAGVAQVEPPTNFMDRIFHFENLYLNELEVLSDSIDFLMIDEGLPLRLNQDNILDDISPDNHSVVCEMSQDIILIPLPNQTQQPKPKKMRKKSPKGQHFQLPYRPDKTAHKPNYTFLRKSMAAFLCDFNGPPEQKIMLENLLNITAPNKMSFEDLCSFCELNSSTTLTTAKLSDFLNEVQGSWIEYINKKYTHKSIVKKNKVLQSQKIIKYAMQQQDHDLRIQILYPTKGDSKQKENNNKLREMLTQKLSNV